MFPSRLYHFGSTTFFYYVTSGPRLRIASSLPRRWLTFCFFVVFLLCDDSRLLLQQFIAFELCCVMPLLVIRSRRGRFVTLLFTIAATLGTPAAGLMLACLHPTLTMGVMTALLLLHWMLRRLSFWRGRASTEKQWQRSRWRSKEASANSGGFEFQAFFVFSRFVWFGFG